jgi:hypothetical protein
MSVIRAEAAGSSSRIDIWERRSMSLVSPGWTAKG